MKEIRPLCGLVKRNKATLWKGSVVRYMYLTTPINTYCMRVRGSELPIEEETER